jgi:phage shock protein A
MPGIFDRISTILRANINDLLDRAEDPEKMLNQIIRDMESAMRDARVQVRDMLAQQKLLEGDVKRATDLRNEWQRKAELAVGQGRDDLAREALKRKNDYTSQADALQAQLVDQEALVNKLKNDLGALESKYEDAKRNKDALIARQRAAHAKEQMATTASKIKEIPDYSGEFGRFEQKIREKEARASATAEMAEARSAADNAFEALQDPAIEDELAALKAKVAAKQG